MIGLCITAFLCFLIHVVNYDLLGKGGGGGTTIVDVIWINGKRGEVGFFLFLGLGAVIKWS